MGSAGEKVDGAAVGEKLHKLSAMGQGITLAKPVIATASSTVAAASDLRSVEGRLLSFWVVGGS